MPDPDRVRVAVLLSGRGSNLASLLAACAAPDYPATIALVLSNRPDAPGLALAGAIPALAIDHRPYGKDRAAHEAAIQHQLQAHDIQLVCLAGYMRQLTPWLIDRWRGRMLNIHPSLLPAFAGLHTHARALAAGVPMHGCTVHVVTEQLDAGPIIAQAAVPVLPGDTEATLAARVLAQEHRLYPEALRTVASACLQRGPGAEPPALPSPSQLLHSTAMADPKPTMPPVTSDAFLADRQRFWGSFTGFTTGGIVAVIVAILVAIFFIL